MSCEVTDATLHSALLNDVLSLLAFICIYVFHFLLSSIISVIIHGLQMCVRFQFVNDSVFQK